MNTSYDVGSSRDRFPGKSTTWECARSISYIFPAYHSGTNEEIGWVCGRRVKKDPCLSWTSRRGFWVICELVLTGGIKVKVVRKIAWCCRAAHPSVLRRSFHLNEGWNDDWPNYLRAKLALFERKICQYSLDHLINRCPIWRIRYQHKRMANSESNQLVLKLRWMINLCQWV